MRLASLKDGALFLAVILLALILLVRARPNTSVALAAVKRQYKTEVVDQGPKATDSAVQKLVEQQTSAGWDVVTITSYYPDYQNHVGPVYLVVFRKPAA